MVTSKLDRLDRLHALRRRAQNLSGDQHRFLPAGDRRCSSISCHVKSDCSPFGGQSTLPPSPTTVNRTIRVCRLKLFCDLTVQLCGIKRGGGHSLFLTVSLSERRSPMSGFVLSHKSNGKGRDGHDSSRRRRTESSRSFIFLPSFPNGGGGVSPYLLKR